MKDFGKRRWLAAVAGLVLSFFVLTSAVLAQANIGEDEKIDLNGFWMDSRSGNGAIRIVQNENDITGYLLEPFICGAASTNISFTATLKGNKLTGETNTCYFNKEGLRRLKLAKMKLEAVVDGRLLIGHWRDDEGGYNPIGISREKLKITELKLTELFYPGQQSPVVRVPLQYLSVGAHPYDSTKIHGAVTVEGHPKDELTELVLEVIEGRVVRGTAVKAVANLAAPARTALLQPFGDDRKVSIDLPDDTTQIGELLFELPSDEAELPSDMADWINTTTNGTVRLRVRAKTKAGEQATKEFLADSGNVQGVHKLVRYTLGNRYSANPRDVLGRDPGDLDHGGDDWVKPNAKVVLEYFRLMGLRWGDFCNMNGGSFRPDHATHQNGNDVDGKYSTDNAYNLRNAATARTMIDYLNNEDYGSRILFVYVQFREGRGQDSPVSHPEFWNAIRNVTLRDGRLARDVILNSPGHHDHFHWVISDE